MHQLPSDVRYALRQIAHSRYLSVVVVCLVALGIGANTILFSLLNGLLLRTLPVRDPGNLFEVLRKRPVQVRPDENLTYAEYQTLRRYGKRFLGSVQAECPLGLQPVSVGLQQPQLRFVSAVSAALLPDLGIAPASGRLFVPSEDVSSSPIPAILSHRFWKQHLANDSLLGKTIDIKSRPVTVIGVLPENFHGLNLDSQPDVIVPLSAVDFLGALPLRAAQVNLYIRLQGGISPHTAAQLVAPLLRKGLAESIQRDGSARGATISQDELDFQVSLLSLRHGGSRVRELFSKAVLILTGAGIVLLLVVSFNVGGLLLTKSQARRPEFAVRRSLGATTFQIIRQVTTEHFLLGSFGTALGVAVAYLCGPVLLHLFPMLRNPETQMIVQPMLDLSPDWRVMLFVSGSCCLSGIVFGIFPAVAALRFDIHGELKRLRSARTLNPAYRGSSILSLQVALTVVLLSASTSMIHSYWNLLHAQTGFDGSRIVAYRVSPGTAGYRDEQLRDYYQRLLQTTRALPQVQDAALVLNGIMREQGLGRVVSLPGRAQRRLTAVSVSANAVSPGYFETMGMRVVDGRDLRSEDSGIVEPPFPVVIDQTLAQMFFPGRSAIGQSIQQGTDQSAPGTFHVVGVVTPAKYRSLREAPPPMIYTYPMWSDLRSGMMNLYLRTYSEPRLLISQVRDHIAATDPQVPILEVTTLKEDEQNSVWQERMIVVILGFFSAAGLLLAGVGLYGSITQFIMQRRRELAIQIALGAASKHVVATVGLPSIRSVVVGVMFGVPASWAALRLMQSFLYEVDAFDSLSLSVTICLLFAAAFTVSFTPIARVLRSQPAVVLRTE